LFFTLFRPELSSSGLFCICFCASNKEIRVSSSAVPFLAKYFLPVKKINAVPFPDIVCIPHNTSGIVMGP